MFGPPSRRPVAVWSVQIDAGVVVDDVFELVKQAEPSRSGDSDPLSVMIQRRPSQCVVPLAGSSSSTRTAMRGISKMTSLGSVGQSMSVLAQPVGLQLSHSQRFALVHRSGGDDGSQSGKRSWLVSADGS
nr:hypothetical protein [Candidatus Microthrix sp.]